MAAIPAAVIYPHHGLPRLQRNVRAIHLVIIRLGQQIQAVHLIVIHHRIDFREVCHQPVFQERTGNRHITENFFCGGRYLLRFQRPLHGALYFLHIPVIQFVQPTKIQLHGTVIGIADSNGILRANIQAAGGGNHYQHHGGKNADGGKPGTVALHAVGHGGNRDEMLLFIIIALPFLQQTAQHHAAGNHHKIGSGNDHQYRHKKPSEGAQRIGNGHRHIVGTTQQPQPQQSQQIVCPGGLLPCRLAAQQLQRAGVAHLNEGAYHDKGEDNRKDNQGEFQALRLHNDGIVHLAANHVHQPQLRQFIQQRAQRQPHCQTDQRHNQIFPKGHPAQGIFVHAQHIVQAELPIAAADEEGIGIQQEDSGEHRNHYFSQ